MGCGASYKEHSLELLDVQKRAKSSEQPDWSITGDDSYYLHRAFAAEVKKVTRELVGSLLDKSSPRKDSKRTQKLLGLLKEKLLILAGLLILLAAVTNLTSIMITLKLTLGLDLSEFFIHELLFVYKEVVTLSYLLPRLIEIDHLVLIEAEKTFFHDWSKIFNNV